MCIGAGVFCAIERDNEKAQSSELKELWVKFQEVIIKIIIQRLCIL